MGVKPAKPVGVADGFRRRFGHHAFRPDRALVDPVPDQIGLRLGQRIAFAGHDVIVAGRQGDAMVEVAFVRMAGHDGQAVLAALHGRRLGIEAQVAFLFFRAVAFDAVLLEQRLDVFDEINFGVGKNRSRAETGRGRQDQKAFLHIIANCLVERVSIMTSANPERNAGTEALCAQTHSLDNGIKLAIATNKN